jgi:hypothetical protein
LDLHLCAVFRQGLKEAGFVEGQNVAAAIGPSRYLAGRETTGKAKGLPSVRARLARAAINITPDRGMMW